MINPFHPSGIHYTSRYVSEQLKNLTIPQDLSICLGVKPLIYSLPLTPLFSQEIA